MPADRNPLEELGCLYAHEAPLKLLMTMALEDARITDQSLLGDLIGELNEAHAGDSNHPEFDKGYREALDNVKNVLG